MTAIPSGTKFLGIAASVDTTEKRSKLNNSYQEYYTIGDITGYAETTVNISSAQILAMNSGSNPIELLPAAGVGKYYEIEKIVLEYTHLTTPYNCASDFFFLVMGGAINFSTGILQNSADSVCICRWATYFDELDGGFAVSPRTGINIPLRFYSNGDVILGDGTIRAIITYKVRTFGA